MSPTELPLWLPGVPSAAAVTQATGRPAQASGGWEAARGRLPGRSHLLMSQCVPSCPRGGSLVPQRGSPYSALLWEGPPQGLAGAQLFPAFPLGSRGEGAAHLATLGPHQHLVRVRGCPCASMGWRKVPVPSCLGQDPKRSLLCSKGVSLGAGDTK